MLGWFKPRKKEETKPAAAGDDGPRIAALLIKGDSFPLGGLQKQLAKSSLGGRKPTDIELQGDVLSCMLGDEVVAIAPMPAPYPWSDLEGPCATSWMWPKGTNATAAIRPHRTHVLVTFAGGKADPIRRLLLLTNLTAIAAKQPDVLGVYWPYGTMVHFPKLFIEMAESITSPEAPPLYLWVDYRVFKNSDGTFGMFTTGLSSIGHMEMEIPSIAMQPGELREWGMNISNYLIENGPVLKDGNTIGATAEAAFRIRHVPSSFGKEGLVMRFEVK